MGLFDFALHPGQRFTTSEIKELDKIFNSISAYTKRKFRFHKKEIKNITGSGIADINEHRVSYTHEDINLDEFDANWHERIDCRKYLIKDDLRYTDFYYEFEKWEMIIPKVDKFPVCLLYVGDPGNGFITILNSEGGTLSKSCLSKIKSESIKYLKSFR